MKCLYLNLPRQCWTCIQDGSSHTPTPVGPLRCQDAVAQSPLVAAERRQPVLRKHLLNACLILGLWLSQRWGLGVGEAEEACLGWGGVCAAGRASCMGAAYPLLGLLSALVNSDFHPQTLGSLSFGTFTSFPKTKFWKPCTFPYLKTAVVPSGSGNT